MDKNIDIDNKCELNNYDNHENNIKINVCNRIYDDYFRLPTIVQYPWMANIDIPNNVTIKTK